MGQPVRPSMPWLCAFIIDAGRHHGLDNRAQLYVLQLSVPTACILLMHMASHNRATGYTSMVTSLFRSEELSQWVQDGMLIGRNLIPVLFPIPSGSMPAPGRLHGLPT